MRDPYLDELKNDFNKYTNDLKKLKKKLLKTVPTRTRKDCQANRQHCKTNGK